MISEDLFPMMLTVLTHMRCTLQMSGIVRTTITPQSTQWLLFWRLIAN